VKNFVYKTLIITLAIIIIFEFTLGRKIAELENKFNLILTKDGRKEMIIKIKDEMKKAIEKENYLSEEEKKLLKDFFQKIQKEIK